MGPDVDTAPDVVVALFNDRAFGSLERLDLQGPEAPEVVARAWWYGLDARGSAVVGVRSGARTPPEIAAVDVVTGTRRSLLTSFGDGVVDRDELVEPEIVSCPSRSGPEVVARLYRPLPSRARSATICLSPLLLMTKLAIFFFDLRAATRRSWPGWLWPWRP